jgi:hypothetical protein
MEVIKLQFNGVFQGRESEIRITPDNMISVFDFIRVAGGQKDPYSTWNRLPEEFKNEVSAFCTNHKFPGLGQKNTPVISVNGMVKLLFWLPGEMAKQFRSKSAETMIRYLGGDVTLIDEIKKIDQEHINNPNNIAQVFRNEVNSQVINSTNKLNLIFNQDQINTSNKLIAYYGDKSNIFYMFSFLFNDEYYAKFGIVLGVREFHRRVQEHIKEFEYICFHNILQCSNVTKVESDFKETSLFNMNKAKIPKKNTGNHLEIIKLSEIITTEVIKNEMIKVAGDKMIDPPPMYQENESNGSNTLNIEKEKTKQKEEETKQLKLELEIIKIKLEMLKLTQTSNSLEVIQNIIPIETTSNSLEVIENNIQQVKSGNDIITEFIETQTIPSNLIVDTISMNDLYTRYYAWINKTYPNANLDIQRTFTKKLKDLNIVNYRSNISNLNNTSGITNRKIIN